jgi:hypothetical protein
MATQIAAPVPARRVGRSIAAVVVGIVVVFVLSLGTDQLLHVLEIYPPWGQPMHDHGLNALALSYRLVYGVAGGYVTAWLAPRNPVKHAVILGAIGTVLSILGAIGAIALNAGPVWYPIALVITAVPCAWLGGVLYRNKAAAL